ncbi:MAG: FHA domain-containing protein [Gemmatimonadaceae bacterium]|nr:FHA domain-containing protein [Gemmatimonadaceae bacterium]
MSQDWLLDAAAGVAYPLTKSLVRLGRDPRSDVMVLDATVSRRHAELARGAAGWILSVSGSTGATVNEMRVDAPLAISPGDTLQLGTKTFTLVRGELPPGVMPVAERPELADDDPRLLRTTASLPAISRETLGAPIRQEPAGKMNAMALVAVISVAIVALIVWFLLGKSAD